LNKIITIGREFGSGGRELGKRLSDHLGIAYYDKEIIDEIAKRTQLAEGYVRQVVEQQTALFFPITVGKTFHSTGSDYMLKQLTAVYAEQANVLREMAEKSDCIIVGRCGDYILKDHNPIRLFVYADMDAKVKRCREKADEHENLSDSELIKKIRRVDRDRAKYYRYYTGQEWGNRANYDMCINTSSVPVKELAEALAHLFG
jgi:cytidylate kinase